MDQETDYHNLIERTLSGSQEAYSELYDKTIKISIGQHIS